MWNYLVSGLAVGSTVVLFDGNPAYPDISTLWRLAAETRATYLGVSAAFDGMPEGRLAPGATWASRPCAASDRPAAPLPDCGVRVGHDAVSSAIPVGSLSGGTDLETASSDRARSCPCGRGDQLPDARGARRVVRRGRPLDRGSEGEMVITAPMPSCPLPCGATRTGRASGTPISRPIRPCGDRRRLTITERGSCIVSGRSDRHAQPWRRRIGTGEFYGVEALPDGPDSLVVHSRNAGGGPASASVRRAAGRATATTTSGEGSARRWEELSPRQRARSDRRGQGDPRTLSGKKLEVRSSESCAGRPRRRPHRATRSRIPVARAIRRRWRQRAGERRLGALVAGLSLAFARAGCSTLLQSAPDPTPSRSRESRASSAGSASTVSSWTAGDPGCDDPTSSPTGPSGSRRPASTRRPAGASDLHLPQTGARERRALGVDACAPRGRSTRVVRGVQVSPYVLAGEGPWPRCSTTRSERRS